MIIITGATGQLGSQVVGQLLERVPAGKVGVSVRDPERAASLAARGVRVRRGDFTEPDSLAGAFEGATQVLIISASETGGTAVAAHAAAADAARAAGAERILYTSHQGASADSLFAPMPDHAATERHLAGTGTPFTALRNGFYASTIPHLLGRALETGELVAPADGPVSWTAHADLAEAGGGHPRGRSPVRRPHPAADRAGRARPRRHRRHPHQPHRTHDPPRRRRGRRMDGRLAARACPSAGGHAARHVPRLPARRIRRHRARPRGPDRAPATPASSILEQAAPPLSRAGRSKKPSRHSGRQAPARLHEAALVGKHDELDPVPDAELHEDPPDMSLDGRFAEVQLPAYLGVGQAAHDQSHDLAFPVGEQVEPGRRGHVGDFRPGGEPVKQAPGDGGASSASPAVTTRMPAMMSAGGASLSRKPLAPADSAPATYSSRSKVVSTMTLGPRLPPRRIRRCAGWPRPRPSGACGCPSARRRG